MEKAPLTGSRIRSYRLERGIRQSELAAACEISASYLNLIEHNRRRIGGALLVRIARALDVDHSYLSGVAEVRLAAEIDAAPTFYAVATTGPLSEIVTATEDLRHRISIPRAIRAVGLDVAAPGDFTEALMRIRRNEGTYRMLEGAVQLRENTLFDTAIALPANLVEGDYETRIFLVREGAVVAQFQTEIAVRKVVRERIIFTLAHECPLIYGILSLIIAIAAGWGASAAFQLLRR